jgi:hypothetical protein
MTMGWMSDEVGAREVVVSEEFMRSTGGLRGHKFNQMNTPSKTLREL